MPMTPALTVAHPGHDQTVMGTVKSIKDGHLEVEAKDGKVSAFTIASTTRILRGTAKATAADIKAGERIVVIATHPESGDHAETMTAKEVRLGTGTGKS